MCAAVVVVLGFAYVVALVVPARTIPEELKLILAAVPGLSLVVSGMACLAVVRFCSQSGECGTRGGRDER